MDDNDRKKKQVFNVKFWQGFAVGFLANVLFNKFTMVGAASGLAVGIMMEQSNPKNFPDVEVSIAENWTKLKEYYEECSKN